MAHSRDKSAADRVPPLLLQAMIDNGIDPRAPFVEAAEGWRYGDPTVDVSAPGRAEELILRTLDAMQWIDEQIQTPEDQRDPAAAVLDLSSPDWLD
jgi:hypothetical protein